MNVRVYLPVEIYWQADNIGKVTAEGLEGYFTLLPRHIDYVSVLVPGIMTVTNSTGRIEYFAVDAGTLLKQGDTVFISTRNCVRGTDMENLARIVEDEFKQLDDLEKKARTALAGLEHTMLQRFAEMRKR